MAVGLKALSHKTKLIDDASVQQQLLATHRAYIAAVQKKMAYYPPQQPTTYHRTGDYGRGWAGPGSVMISATESRLVNRNAHSVYVGGPKPGEGPGRRQTAVMARKGWPSISTIAHDTIKLYKPLYNAAVKGRANVSISGA